MARPIKYSHCTVEGCGAKHHGKGYCARHYETHARDPERKRATRQHHAEGARGRFYELQRSAKRRGIPVELTFVEYGDILRSTDGQCFYCGGEVPRFGHGLDRVDNAKGYTADNLVPCCTQCNLAKGKANQYFYISWLARASQRALQLLKKRRFG